jgi:hypothetical protein
MDDANALPDAGDRGGIDRGGDDDGVPTWVYRLAASSARLVARLLAKNGSEWIHRRPRGGGMRRAREGCCVLCVVAVLAESTYVGHAFSHELRM